MPSFALTGQTATMNDDPTIEQRLKAIADASPGLSLTVRLYSAVLPILRDEAPPVLPDEPSAEEAKAQMERGTPVLEGRDLDVDVEQAMALFLRLASAAEQAGEQVSVERVRRWIHEEQGGDAGAAFQAILSSCEESSAGEGWERMGIDGDLCQFLVQAALKPLLRAWWRKFHALSDEVKWSQGICSICGSGPLLADLQGNEQARHLRCGLCGADWRVARMSCVHCGTEDHRTLRVFFPGSDHTGPRIEACDKCMTYVKVLPAFSPTPVDLLIVEDLATLNLDAEAQKRSYRRAAETC